MPETAVITLGRPARWDEPFGQEKLPDAAVDRLLKVEPFSQMDAARFPRTLPLRGILQNDARLVQFKRGDIVVREGDYGHSAFLILRGGVRVATLPAALIGRRKRQRRGWLGTLVQMLTKPRLREARDLRRYPQMIQRAPGKARSPVFVQDVVNVLAEDPDVFDHFPTTALGAGEVFGELAALGRIPRTATVLADTDTELLEIRWQGLRDLRKFDAALRQHTDRLYRERGLLTHLGATPLFAHLGSAELHQMADVAVFETFGEFDWYGTYRNLRQKNLGDPLAIEPVIAEQGHYPNGLVLIRAGFARLSVRLGHSEQTVSYLGKGSDYGLTELVHNWQQPDDLLPLQYTLRAVGYVDVIRLPTTVIEKVVLPTLSADELSRLAPKLAAKPVLPAPVPVAAPMSPDQIQTSMLEFLVENRFINGTATMLIDLDRCTRCDACVQACADGHNNNPAFVRHGTHFGHYMIANACMHCADPVCMIGCPTGAIHRDEESGSVVINDLTCIGCSLCANSCPYDNIRMVEIRDVQTKSPVIDTASGRPIVKATKCDLCVDQMGGPACQRACPHDALARLNMQNIPSLAGWLNR